MAATASESKSSCFQNMALFDFQFIALYRDILNRNVNCDKKKNACIEPAHEKLWHFSSSVNSFFKRACTAMQWI